MPDDGTDVADGSVPWLDDGEMAAWLNLAELITTLPAALDARMQRDAGITFYEYMVMAMLSEQPDRTLQLSELAELTSGSLSRLSHVITRLEKQGWVERQRSPHNARARNAVLTEAGMDKVRAAAPAHAAEVRALVFDGLTRAQVRQLEEVLVPVLERVRPPGHEPRHGRGRGRSA
ncbi:MarR family transcriptional regulator [Georgenia sp. MJ206]|uniref:MarR family winged helix-turn-helix transcriptional regulator n=1 Tax=Georgenia wangjunii TaxID=3117730 RepID=UPI002F2691F2